MKKELVEILQKWFNEELGNRVTVNNFPMLITKIMLVVNVEEERKETPEVEDELPNS